MSSRKEQLERAREHCFFTGSGDGGTTLCQAVTPYGIAKIHHVQRELGHPPDATFIGAPDASVTKNRTRWRQGFGYGGSYGWSGAFIPLDIKPNCCGMIAGTLEQPVDREVVRERLARLKDAPPSLDGVTVDWDFDVGNHFVDVFEVTEDRCGLDAPYGFIVHTAGRELREETSRGPGLYFDRSAALRELAREFETPWGSLTVLVGDAAAAWYAFYREAEAFSQRRRELLTHILFGDDARVVSNHTHQGLVRSANHANLGCYVCARGDGTLFPFTLSATLPAYLVASQPSLSEAVLQRIGWAERGRALGVYERLADANLLPHGGGYTYPDLDEVVVHDDGADERRFELRWRDARHDTVIDLRDVPSVFRGNDVYEQLRELELGRPVAKLEPLFALDGSSIS